MKKFADKSFNGEDYIFLMYVPFNGLFYLFSLTARVSLWKAIEEKIL